MTMQHDVITNGSMLHEALKLNSDLGRHARKCSFSTNLTGRFYENNSMQSHKARAHRIAQMKTKRKQLEKSLLMEEKKIYFLEEELKKKVIERRRENEWNDLKDLSAIRIQCQVRKMLAIQKLELRKVDEQILNYVARFIQALFRGRRDRRNVQSLRLKIAKHKKEQLACTRLQTLQRKRIAYRILKEKQRQLVVKRYNCACKVQSIARGRLGRKICTNARKEKSAICIQCMYRVSKARKLKKERKRAIKTKKEKADRIPLHERRYSTYSVDARKVESARNIFSDESVSTGVHSFVKGRRRMSLVGLDISRKVESARNMFSDESVSTGVHSFVEGRRRMSLAGGDISRKVESARNIFSDESSSTGVRSFVEGRRSMSLVGGDISRKVESARNIFSDESSSTGVHSFVEGRRRVAVVGVDISQEIHCTSSRDDEGKRLPVLSLPVQTESRHDDSDSKASETSERSEKIWLARQRASLRARKLKEKCRIKEQLKAEQITSRKEELAKLEEKRRAVMKTMQMQRICNKDSTKVSTSRTCIKENQKQDQLHSKKNPRSSTVAEKRSGPSRSGLCDISQTEVSFCWDDEDFEENVKENENDLL